MSSPFETAATEARRLAEEFAAELKQHPAMSGLIRNHAGLNAIEDLMQVQRTSLGELLGLGDLAATGGSQLSRVKFDEFVAVPALEAAKKYLRKGNDARPFQEIVDAIKAGGGKVEDEENLRVGLSRSTLDIVKLGDRYGLLEHYPRIQRGGSKNKKPKTADAPSAVEPGEAENGAAKNESE
jgi:hypothetical protein